jgi:putative FmdB family regulatory protein
MPLYEYRCPVCGRRFEVLQRVGEGVEGVVCPGCGRPDPERQHSTFASSGGGASPSAGGCGGGRFT